MNTKIRLVLGILALAAGMNLRAAEPPSPIGHILLLDNERTLEGDIERVGDQFRIRHAVGETWVPTTKAMALCADLKDAYAFLRRRANLDDPGERLKLARWCQSHDLLEQALAEAEAAIALRPELKDAQRLARVLHQPSPEASKPAAPNPMESEAAPSPPVVLPAEAANQFTTRIQPILMNACASCHANGQGGSFKLLRVFEHGSLERKTTQQNLTAVLGQLNLEQAEKSPILTKATSVHGAMSQAPLTGRQTSAYHALEGWVKTAVATQSTPRESTVQPAAEGQPRAEKTSVEKVEKPPAEKTTAEAAPTSKSNEFSSEKRNPAPKEPADPFDPAIFNKKMHPDK
jgi:hypothetical protein